jgi:hypothetical protein
MSNSRAVGIGIAAALLAASFPSHAQNSAAGGQGSACFYSNQFESWRAPDNRTILIRVGLSQYYRLDLAGPCGGITLPFAHLINRVHGPNTICKALDWDLAVSDSPTGGFEHGCIVKSMTRLTPEEVASIPVKFKP